jgi:hypothetical protein
MRDLSRPKTQPATRSLPEPLNQRRRGVVVNLLGSTFYIFAASIAGAPLDPP